MVISDDSGFVIYGFISAILHEIGHILAMVYFRKNIKKIEFGFANIDLLMEEKNLNCNSFETVVIFLSGSLLNFLISILFKILYSIFGFAVFDVIFYQNLFLGIINLLPIYSLDGECLFRKFLENNFSDILNEIKKAINTDCYCISPEDLVAALNRWSLNKTVTNRKKNGACIACGKPITSGRIACDIHINIS